MKMLTSIKLEAKVKVNFNNESTSEKDIFLMYMGTISDISFTFIQNI